MKPSKLRELEENLANLPPNLQEHLNQAEIDGVFYPGSTWCHNVLFSFGGAWWMDCHPELVLSITVSIPFEELLEMGNINLDVNIPWFQTISTKQSGSLKVVTKVTYQAEMPAEYRKILKDLGKIQTTVETQTSIFCLISTK